MNEKNVVNDEDDPIIKNSSDEGALGLNKKEEGASGTTLLHEESPEQNGSIQLKETLLIRNKKNIGPGWSPQDRFLVLFTLLCTAIMWGALILIIGPGLLIGFDFVVEHLPLALPILTAILSIASRPHELRTVQGIMNVANYLALGLVTFSIWAFVAAQTANQYIVVGTRTVLNKDYSLILLLGAFIWSGFSAVVTALAEGTSEGRQKRLWQYVQGGVFAISFALMISPFFLFEQKKVIEQNLGISFDKRNFTVSIAFRDPALDHHLGFSANPLNRCEVYKSVSAQNREEAVRLALEKFNQSGSAMQFNRHAPVEIFESWIVAESEVSKPLQ